MMARVILYVFLNHFSTSLLWCAVGSIFFASGYLSTGRKRVIQRLDGAKCARHCLDGANERPSVCLWFYHLLFVMSPFCLCSLWSGSFVCCSTFITFCRRTGKREREVQVYYRRIGSDFQRTFWLLNILLSSSCNTISSCQPAVPGCWPCCCTTPTNTGLY